MATCDICKIVENKASFKVIYEDDLVFAILHESPAIEGHALVIPKKHSPILEELDDKSVERLFVIANKISTSVFDTLGAHGTNIILNNGIDAGQELPHVVLNVLPRQEKDNINIEWQARKATEGELKTSQSMIKSISDFIFSGKDSLPQVELKKDVHNEEIKPEEDYTIKSLKRIP
jgi:histidine triad (HIT) family protein